MPAPAKVVMDDLAFIGDALRDEGRFEDALTLDTLIEAANRAGHHVYTWDGVVGEVRRCLEHLTLPEDVLDLIDAALSPPKV